MKLTLILFLLSAAARADCILVTEVVTDPQADHSENSGGNGVPFDLEPGDGTVSSVDEFVELYNAGTEALDLTGFSIEFRDTTPSSFVFGTSSGILRFSDGSSLESLEAGAFVLLGNPPGTVNNKVTIDVRDPLGALVDSFEIQDGNASSDADEAIFRAWTGEIFLDQLQQGVITPLAPPAGAEPVPEPPAAALLLGVSLLAAVGASARRARCGSRRRSREVPQTRPCRT
jgi:hypothetical protein